MNIPLFQTYLTHQELTTPHKVPKSTFLGKTQIGENTSVTQKYAPGTQSIRKDLKILGTWPNNMSLAAADTAGRRLERQVLTNRTKIKLSLSLSLRAKE